MDYNSDILVLGHQNSGKSILINRLNGYFYFKKDPIGKINLNTFS